MSRSVLFATLIAAPLALAAQSASATTVAYTGSGSFSSITNCGGYPTCSISSSGGTNNQLSESGYSGPFYYPGPASTLTAVTTTNSFTITTARIGAVIGELDWINRPTTNTDESFGVTFTYKLAFTQPSASSDSQAFSLTIQQTTNPSADNTLNVSNATLSQLGPFVLNGVTVSNIHFALASGDQGSYNGVNWTNPESNTSRLMILADIQASPTAVPEPMSLALLGSGLLGLGLTRRKRTAA